LPFDQLKIGKMESAAIQASFVIFCFMKTPSSFALIVN